MGKCGVCEETGHNKRTCPKLTLEGASINTQKSQLSTSSRVHGPSLSPRIIKGEIIPIPPKPPQSNLNVAIEKKEVKIVEKIKSTKTFDNNIRQKDAELIKKLEVLPKIPQNVEKVSNFCTGCHNSNVATWLIKQSRSRFLKGPTEKDGPGFIYIYTYLNPKSDDERNVYKIGMSEHEDGKRRVEVQEKKNKEKYQVLYHDSTPFRYMTESVIHLHLKDSKDPREFGDGRTEWFRSEDRNDLIRIIKDVIKEVRFAVENSHFQALS